MLVQVKSTLGLKVETTSITVSEVMDSLQLEQVVVVT